MDKKSKGFGFGVKTDSKQKRDEPQKKTGKSQWGPNKSKTKRTDERSPVEHRPSYLALDYKLVRVSDVIVIDSGHRKMNEETASRIAEIYSCERFFGFNSRAARKNRRRLRGEGRCTDPSGCRKEPTESRRVAWPQRDTGYFFLR